MLQLLAKLNRLSLRQLSRLIACVATSVLAPAVLASPASASITTIFLDSYNPIGAPSPEFCTGPAMMTTTPPGCGNTVAAPVVFTAGASYAVAVTGAVSSWGEWPFRRCGKVEPSSEFASPGVSNRPASDDAQFRLAKPLFDGRCPKLPQKTSFFQVNLGSGWFHPVASSNPTKPSTDKKVGLVTEQHPYAFTFVGQGVAPQFRYVDYHAPDNSGQFKISITG